MGGGVDLQPNRPPATVTVNEELFQMFVTVFTVGTMGFVLLAPLVMVAVLVLSHTPAPRPQPIKIATDDQLNREFTRAA
jgi:hypothetical protein